VGGLAPFIQTVGSLQKPSWLALLALLAKK